LLSAWLVGVVLRRDVQLLDQRQGLVVHGGVVADHFAGEVAHGLVLGLGQGLLAGGDVDVARGVGDMGDLGVVELGRLGVGRARDDEGG